MEMEAEVERSIVGFHRDEEGHWVARLDCGHPQHVRHDPPFKERPWVQSEAGRASRLGAALECVRCDRREIPAGHVAAHRTPEFDEASVPDALRTRHTTKAGVWGCIHVREGRLRYTLHAPFHAREILDPGTPGIVVPGVEHEVEPLGPVRFFLELYRASA